MNAFWSLTMYDGKTQLLVDNPINRYLLNSRCFRALRRRRRIADALHPEGFTRRGQGDELAARTERRLLHAAAAVLAEGGRARWPMEGPGRRENELGNVS